TVEARAVESVSGAKQIFAVFRAIALRAEQLPARVVVTPATATVDAGESVQLSAAARDAGNAAIAGAIFEWTSSDTTVATVASNGRVTGVKAGTARINANYGGRTGSAQLTVRTNSTPEPDAEPDPDPEPQQGTDPTDPSPVGGSTALVNECATPGSGWIFCDDFEQNRLNSYFEYDAQNGSFSRASGVGVDGSSAMRARFAAGQAN